ncbi:MAG TPA: Ig-like domain-containing protein [Longimicrobiales bacterium]|nr:Ig-like domain-containing protein [Longimicrobiales bacterium]
MSAMRGSMMLAVLLAASCTETGVDAPFTLEPAAVAVSLEFAGEVAAGGPRSAYMKTNRLELRFTSGSTTREEQLVEFAPADTESHVPAYVRLRSPTEELQFALELRFGADAVFRGSTPVMLRAGRTTPATVVLKPVVAGIAGPDGLPVMTAYGDTLRLDGAALFATGDTIDASAGTWTSLDPGVATVAEDGILVARSDGTARLVARLDAFSDTVLAEVFAEVSAIDVSPSNQSIPVGVTRQYTASPVDRRGNPITGRTIVWSTSDPSVVTIDAAGMAKAVGIGTARVIATIGGTDGHASASAEPGAPLTENLTVRLASSPITATFDADVFPNGGQTDTWFEWAPVSTSAQASLTIRRDIGAGLLRVPVGTTVQGLLPRTTYEVRIVATNAAGRHESEGLFFTTGDAPPTVKTLPAAGPTPPDVTLSGTVNANGLPAMYWFEWGTDSTAVSVSTAAQPISGSTATTVTAVVPSGAVGTTWYFRIVASNAAGTSAGAFLSWTVMTTPQPPGTAPLATTLPATDIKDFRATLHGTAVPNGSAADAWFEYGDDPALSVSTATAMQAVGSGNSPVAFSFDLFGPPMYQQTFYYRAVVRTAGGTTRGAIVAMN